MLMAGLEHVSCLMEMPAILCVSRRLPRAGCLPGPGAEVGTLRS